jgi:hypothetical protein
MSHFPADRSHSVERVRGRGDTGIIVRLVTELSKRDEHLRTRKATVHINRAAQLDAIILADVK